MIFKNILSKDDLNSFDDYFSIKIKSFERPFLKNSNIGKNFFIGGKKSGEIISIMSYDEFEKVELDALDLCDTIPEHDGFLKFQKVFHHNFPKGLSHKVLRINNEKKINRSIIKTRK